MEIWKKTPLGLPFMEVSSLGRVRVLERVTTGVRQGVVSTQRRPGTVLSQELGTHGYMLVRVKHAGKRRKYLVHRLVAAAFCPGFNPRLTVNHRDDNKLNNRWRNLEWVTRPRNTELQWETGIADIRGDKHPSTKIKDKDIPKLCTRFIAGEPRRAIAERFGISVSLVYKIMRVQRRVSSPR